MKAKTPPDTTRLGLYIRPETDRQWGYFHIHADIVTIGTTAYERRAIDRGETISRVNYQTIRNCRDDVRGLYLEGLLVTSQGRNDDSPRHLYGFEYEYRNHHAIDANKARRMARTLETIAKRLEKSYERFAAPASFGAYLARIADAIGADAIVTLDGNQPRGSSYGENSNTIRPIRDGVYHVDGLIRAWIKETEPQPETETATA